MRRIAFFIFLLVIAPASRAAQPGASHRPMPRETLQSYTQLEGWIREWAVPVRASFVDPDIVTAACVTLRLSGKVIGRGTHVSSDGDAMWSAARQAWLEAQTKLPVARDALRDQAIRDLTPRIMISLQLAGPMVPLLGGRFDDAALPLSPGIDGIAARARGRASAIFPGTALALNFTPELAMRGAVGGLDLPPKELDALRADHGVSVLKFRVSHLAQTSAGAAPVFLTRGSKAVPLSSVTGPNLREFASRMAEHLHTHEWPGDEPHGMSGDYIATIGRYRPGIAPPRTQAVACLALLRYAQTPAISEALRTRARIYAKRVLLELTQVSEQESNPLENALDAAAWLIADSHMPRADRYTEQTAEFRAAATDLLIATALDTKAMIIAFDPPERAMLACALASIARADQSPPTAAELARAHTLALYRETPGGQLVALMPWLAMATSKLSTGDTPPDAPPIGAVALREARANVWAYQLSAAELPPEEMDLAGGIVFTHGRNPLPTWHSLRPLSFIAMTLDDPAITDAGEVMEHFAALRRSLRFVMQMSLREPDMHMCRDEKRSLGGVRLSVWDARASLDATALALLTVCETLISLENISNR